MMGWHSGHEWFEVLVAKVQPCVPMASRPREIQGPAFDRTMFFEVCSSIEEFGGGKSRRAMHIYDPHRIFSHARTEPIGCPFPIGFELPWATATLYAADPAGLFVGDCPMTCTNYGFLEFQEDYPVRCCNFHGMILEKVGRVNKRHAAVQFNSRDLFQCPAKGCTVSWWGGSNGLPANKETRLARKQLYEWFVPNDATARVLESRRLDFERAVKSIMGDDAKSAWIGAYSESECKLLMAEGAGRTMYESRSVFSDRQIASQSGRRRMSLDD